MGKTKDPGNVKLIAGLFAGDISIFPRVKSSLSRIFGPVDFESAIIDFDHTDYYEVEFGKGLKRKFLAFKKTVDLKDMAMVKVRTNSLERKFSKDGKRVVNIDPGYVDLAKVILLSTKDYSHRIYLDKGIYAEATLFYKDKTFNAWPWTYPDYRSGVYIDVFNRIRELYRER